MESFFSTLKLELGLDDNREDPILPLKLQRDLAFWMRVTSTVSAATH